MNDDFVGTQVKADAPNIFARLLSKVRRGYNVTKSSWKIKSVIAFIMIVFVVNAILLSQGNYSIHPTSTKDIIGNSLYLTTTQLSTIGYGDITPVSLGARFLTSIVHIAVIYITFSIAEEFGALSVAGKRSEERHIMYTNNELMRQILNDKQINSLSEATKTVRHMQKVGEAGTEFKNLLDQKRRMTQ